MQSSKLYIAYLLLLLFFRVMVPDVAILALHEHDHTEDAIRADVTIERAHLHCDVTDIYDGGFIAPPFWLEHFLTPKSGCYTQPYSFAWKFTYPNNTYLRGPPLV